MAEPAVNLTGGHYQLSNPVQWYIICNTTTGENAMSETSGISSGVVLQNDIPL